MNVPHTTEVKKYGFEFLQRINQNYSLYGNGSRRVIVGSDGIISYIISGSDIEPFSWDIFKQNSPVHSIDDTVRC